MKNINGYIKLICALYGEKLTDEILNKYNNVEIIPYVDNILNLLTREERNIINLRFGLDTEDKAIKKIECKAILKMRNPEGPSRDLARFLNSLT